MTGNHQDEQLESAAREPGIDEARRASLRRLGRFAAITPPAVVLILAASAKPAAAAPSVAFSSRQLKEPVAVGALRRAV